MFWLVRVYLRMIALLAMSAVAIRTLRCDRYLVSRMTWTESKAA